MKLFPKFLPIEKTAEKEEGEAKGKSIEEESKSRKDKKVKTRKQEENESQPETQYDTANELLEIILSKYFFTADANQV